MVIDSVYSIVTHMNDGWTHIAGRRIWLPAYPRGRVWENGRLIVFGSELGTIAICERNWRNILAQPYATNIFDVMSKLRHSKNIALSFNKCIFEWDYGFGT